VRGDRPKEKMVEALKDLRMSAVYTIDKGTMLVGRVTTTITAPELSDAAGASGKMSLRLYDFDKPVSVTLPPEAAAATEK